MNEFQARKRAFEIIGVFDSFLEERGIMIPSSDRTGRRDEAAIFGWDYYELEHEISRLLRDL